MVKVITSIDLPPPILIKFNPMMLLNFIQGIKWRVENKIIPRAKTKIRHQDVGKSREFERLYLEYKEVYERKEIEEKEYQAKIKKSKKMPSIPNSQGTVRFKRMESTE